MGLAVIHGIIKSLDGGIILASEPGKGTSFTVYFPEIGGNYLSAVESPDDLPGGEEHILFVDDEISIVNSVKLILCNLGYEVTAVTNSNECLEIFNRNPDRYDQLITDMTMPKLTGKDLAGRILSIRSDIPVILCTGYSDQIDESKAEKMGIKAFIMKPINIHDIAIIIRNVLDGKKL